MFCSECGKEASGRFCWSCGALLHTEGATAPSPASAAVTAAPAPDSPDWEDEINYDALLRNPKVRDILANQNHPAQRMTGEEFAEACGKLLSAPVPLVPAMGIMQDVFGRLGVHAGQTRAEQYQLPAGRVIVGVLCALANGGYKVQEVHQAYDGCVLLAQIPSDLLSF